MTREVQYEILKLIVMLQDNLQDGQDEGKDFKKEQKDLDDLYAIVLSARL